MEIDPRAAPLRLRATASVVNAVLAVGLGGGLTAVAIAVALLRGSRRGRLERVGERAPGFVADRRVTVAVQVVSPLVELRLRRSRSPGWRMAGIHRVDARTGDPETLRSAVVRILLGVAVSQALHRVNAPGRERLQARQAELHARMEAAREQPGDDPDQREHAIVELGGENARGCATAMIRPLALTAVEPLTALLSPRRQTVIERLAGVAVVRERGGRARPRRLSRTA